MLNLEQIIKESLTETELVLFHSTMTTFNATKGYVSLGPSYFRIQSKSNSAVKYKAYILSVLDGEIVISRNSNGERTMPITIDEFLFDVRLFIRGKLWE